MDQLLFTIPEILSLIGVTQCVYLLVYILLRAGWLSRAGLPLLYFLVLGLAFLSDFAAGHLDSVIPHYDYIRWFAWFYGPPLSVLLVVQVAQITKVPGLRDYWVLLLPPVAFASAMALAHEEQDRAAWLVVCGLVAGAISLLAIWSKSGLFDSLKDQKAGRERFWLIVTLIVVNIFFLATALASLSPGVSSENIMLIRTVLGLGFAYIASTSLLRIYPQAVQLSTARDDSLSAHEKELAIKIENLLKLDKVYQEPTYSRADLARECSISESVLSKVINTHFRKSFPQLMNEHRIEDAKRLLKETDMPVRAICEDVGFNSLPSFNRVFKDITGEAPSAYRKIQKT